RPAVLHMRCVRLGGHAGSDAEVAYRSHRSIEADLAHDPILATARALVGAGVLSREQVLALDSQIMQEVSSTAESYTGTRRLDTAMHGFLAAPPLPFRARRSRPHHRRPNRSMRCSTTPWPPAAARSCSGKMWPLKEASTG